MCLSSPGTREWLKRRPWLSSHFHLKCPERLEKFQGREARERVVEAYNRLLAADTNITTDFARLGRHLQGQAIGLVLGGGGARGAAHLGMIRLVGEDVAPGDDHPGRARHNFCCPLISPLFDDPLINRTALLFSF
jgi:lysophospholipid hydrolase